MPILVTPAKIFKDAFTKVSEEPIDQDGTIIVTDKVAAKFKAPDGTIVDGGTIFGEPRWESPDPLNREKLPNGSEARLAFSHDWSEDELRWITENVVPTHKDSALLNELPLDWYVPPEIDGS